MVLCASWTDSINFCQRVKHQRMLTNFDIDFQQFSDENFHSATPKLFASQKFTPWVHSANLNCVRDKQKNCLRFVSKTGKAQENS